ncbi:iron sulfur cluster assembly protein 1, mitochondrial [Pneumocystis carinii B80]|uniref:Iron-sulfur cluster assembly protein n=1 Tax=Pneumocystis carinii (strain B80) TaxID=1408658 RepID=A0A0W4ZR09_PNEC8|nr:iron sulfur cluster assembly protein 1, mitochondrial [Pneumocystis carinii B80]KTW30813.1 iron sulfur cluster assembly protein 1, mitochondrial [Pneumocystis carinii B80]
MHSNNTAASRPHFDKYGRQPQMKHIRLLSVLNPLKIKINPVFSYRNIRKYHEKDNNLFSPDHYNNPRNVGSMKKEDPDVGIGLVGAPACGDVMRLSIRVDSEGRISEAKFKTFGCGSAIASSSYMTELIKGMKLEEASKVKNTEIAKELCLPPVKLHCSMLAEDAIKSAIKDYQSKSKNRLDASQKLDTLNT